MTSVTPKQAMRISMTAQRDLRTREERDAAGESLAARVLELADVAAAQTVAVYLSVGPEPPTWPLVDALHARGTTVLAPMLGPDRVLDWAPYAGPERLHTIAYGLTEPTGDGLGADAIATASAIILPAVAVDHVGHRLGRGAGYYDRALALSDPTATRIAVVFDDELVDDVPTDAHDEPVHIAVTPTRTWVCAAD